MTTFYLVPFFPDGRVCQVEVAPVSTCAVDECGRPIMDVFLIDKDNERATNPRVLVEARPAGGNRRSPGNRGLRG